MKKETQLLDEFLKKREILEKIKDTSFKYTFLIKKIPIKRTNYEEMKYLVEKFDELINAVKNLFNSKQNEIQTNKN